MLTYDLLVTRTRGDTITPAFVPPDEEHLELAREIIAVFKDYTGRRLGELNGILEEMGDEGFDYRLVRGLVSLLERRCDLVVDSAAEPSAVRQAAFEAAFRRYPVTDPAKRGQVLEEAAASLGLTPAALERSMYADLQDQLIIRHFREPGPAALLADYNLGLAQALLFKATRLRFRLSTGHQEVLRRLKWLGLMYDAVNEGDRLDITVEGPVSALKMTERYGTALARLLPAIVGSPGWNFEAAILRKDYSGAPKLYRFAMAAETHGRLFPQRDVEAPEFDSSVEEAFQRSFGNAGTGWAISREPEPLITGKYLYIPDFLLEKDGIRVYVEIAGFWTPEYLQRKVAKLREVRNKNLIVIASDKMSCEAFRDVPGVIFYDKKIPMKPVLDRLKGLEKEAAASGAALVARSGLCLSGAVVRLEALAAREGVSLDSIKAYLDNHLPAGYLVVGEDLVSEVLIDELRAEMPAEMAYAKAADRLRQRGLSSIDAILQALGYAVRWSGLDPDSARVCKVDKTGR